jgi:HlyB family type I secretion system ABC transporter
MSNNFIDRLGQHPDFRMLSDEECREIIRKAAPIEVNPSQLIKDTGDLADGFYFVLSGKLDLVSEGAEGQRVVIDTLLEGALEACDVLNPDEKMPYRLQAGTEKTIIQFLAKSEVTRVLESQPEIGSKVEEARRLREVLDFLSEVKSLEGIPREGLASLARHPVEETIAEGAVVIKQGETDDSLFLVKEGQFFVTRDEAPGVRIDTLGNGSILGEIAVLTGKPRGANVTADAPSVIYRVPGPAFRDLVAEHQELSDNLKSVMGQRIRRADALTKDVDGSTSEPGEQGATPPQENQDRRRKAAAETVMITRGWFARHTKLPAIRQHSQMDCGAACLSTICKYFGKDVSINTTREIARVRQEGASMANVMRALGEIGFKSEAFISSIDQLREKKLPAIANWKGYHWIVVYEITDTQVICADPAEGIVKHKIDDFITHWSRYTIFVEPTTQFESFPESKPSISAFFSFYAPYKKTILELFLLAIFMQVLAIASPLFSKFVIDEIIMKGDQQWLMSAIYIMCVVTVLTMAMDYISDIMALRLSLRCNFNMISHVYSRLMRLPISYFEARKIGDITNRLEQHEQVTEFITEDGLDTFINLLTAVAYTILMFSFNVWLTVSALSFLLLNFFVVRYISPRLRQIERESFVKEAEQESHTIESLQAAGTLKTLGAQHQSRWKYESNFAAVANLEFKEAKLSQAAEIFTTMLDSLGDAAILFLGGYYVMQGDMTIGDLIAFQVFANGVQGPINALVGKWDEIQEVKIAVERMNDVLEKEPELPDDGDLDPVEAEKIRLPRLLGRVEFDNVTFRYEPDDQANVVQAVSFEIEPGQTVAFVGASGCGKSTLIKLLYSFYDLSSGRIMLDGFNQKDVTLKSLRKQIAMVPQKSLLLRASIRDNIAMARPNATLEEIIEAAELAQAHEFISKMPGGYDAMLVEQGGNLSGGQRQRICLARAFLQNSSILVLDEATSALDVETERVVMENVDARFGERSVIIIAHRLSTVRRADRIIVLNSGLIAESGTHDELMDNKGLYYSLNGRQQAAE